MLRLFYSTGDIVGGGLTTDAAVDAELALRKPFGSAEQNLYNFAYTLYNLKYLKATNQLRPEILEANLGFMNLCTYFFIHHNNSKNHFDLLFLKDLKTAFSLIV